MEPQGILPSLRLLLVSPRASGDAGDRELADCEDTSLGAP